MASIANKDGSDHENNNIMEAEINLHKPKKLLFNQRKCIDFSDNTPLPPDLERIYHEPIYELPILTNPKYRHLDIQKRAELLSDYLTKISNIRADLAKRSLLMAPQPKPILPSSKCVNSLLRDDTSDNSNDIEEFQEDGTSCQPRELYVSRFGRQTKRKVYTEEETEIDTIIDERYEDGDLKITLPHTIVDQSKSEPIIKEYSPLRAKRQLPRAERLFENLVKDDEKRKEQEAEMQAFEKTLQQSDEESHENGHNDSNGTAEMPNTFKSLRRKVPNAKKRSAPTTQEDLDTITVMPGSSVKSENLPPKSKKSKEAQGGEKEIACPICNIKFSSVEVEEHAATCEEFMQES